IALAFGLSAFFWMPALQQVNEIQIGRLDYDPNYYYRTSLMQGSSFISDGLIQDYGPRSPGGDFGYPVELGLVQVIMATAALGLLVWQRRKGKNEVFGHLSFLTLAALVYYAIMFPWSLFLWEKVPLMSYLQSPWRLLPFLTLSTAVLIGYLGRWAACLRSRWGTVALGLLVLLATVPNVVNLQPRYVDLREDDVSLVGSLRFEMLSQNLGMTASAEYLPKGVRSKMATSPIALDTISSNQPPSPFDPSFLAAGAGVEVLEARSTVARFRVNSPGGTPFLFNQTYFPGWKAYLDGQEMALNGVGTANLMSLQVPSGSHNLEFRFEETRVRLLGKAVSLASLIALLVILLIALRQRLRAPPGPVKFNQAGLNTGSLNRPLLFIGLIAIEALIGAYLAPRMDSPSQAVAPFRAEATWSGGPTLLGYDLNSATFRPGQSIGLVLYWSERPPSQEVRIGVKGRTGRVWSQGVSNPVPPQDERDAKRTYQITLPKDIPPGMYQITLDILSNGKPLPILKEGLARPIFPEKSVLLGPVFIGRGEPVTEERVNVTTRRETNLENQVALLGYDLTVGARSLDLTTYWKTLSIMREDYAIFAHLLDLGDKVLVFNDLNPEGNPYATTLWRPGEVVTVPFHFDLPPDFQPESHRLRIGLYTPDNFHRLSVLDAAGQPVTNTIFLPLMPSPGK
ncbi:MAG: hypothetical protein Q8P59_00215, partial [Dehalococcoidia bacterium]|nr:hypothetical protein [Dehalococcoidia bacterium]